ncbi:MULTISPECIES: aminopeptidase N [Micromonospora]|uniref:Aminopeptidase N n=1 Tax=Micromonospora maris TaxID=1003110 RepID=A0A9X0I352_9ACTN|nr:MULTISPECIES: aminopeptidase N [Micromonospora]AEB46765.1 aminopeptidase N [Micromonospora maris AB-18-032]KUJ45947.1 aminopeptidase N [Micromonospora maris]RUL90713.1 aminopeptidase N [Verrucosispora sp. FIM060022]
MPSLSRAESTARGASIAVESYHVDLDLTGGGERFRSQVTIRFTATGTETFAEVKPAKLLAVRLNGVDLDPAGLDDNRLALTGLAEENTLTVEAEMAYTNTGEGLHRFVDPADGETYLYAMSFLDDVQRIFAAFDQPDLKAPVTLSVTAPPHWTVAANAELAAQPGPGRWEFAPTLPISTYLFSLIAGPWHVRRDEHDGVPLGIYCRRSLAEHLDADAEEIFTVTRQCLDRFHQLFDERYPFGKYDQAFVPEFNAGAMENPGLVTFRDDYVFRSAVTDTQRELRATTIAHEMAHMWFGNLVTMRWWDDLWLNESFAEYLGTRVTAEATRFDQAWTTFAMRRKAWGYAADQRPSTHPVAPDELSDAAEALLNFDGISYAKGASVLRQLVAWLGDEPFLAGLNDHFSRHRFGNATLADLLASLGSASGRDLAGWAQAWLRAAQVNTLRAEVALDADGRYREVAVLQTAPPAHPVLRPHRIGVGRYAVDGSADRFEVDLDPSTDGGRTVLDRLTGEPASAVLLPNDGDLTFAKIRLDSASVDAVPLLLPRLADPLARALLWGEALDAATDGERPVMAVVELIGQALPTETEVIITEDVLALSRSLVDRYLDPSMRPTALAVIDEACRRMLDTAPAGGSMQLAAARGRIAATIDAALLTGWLGGRGVPDGLAIDTELRWKILGRLVVLGAAGAAEIEAEATADRSAAGAEHAARYRAALPDPAAKQAAWQMIVADTTVSNRLIEATAAGFWQPEQAELTAEYVPRYFADMPAMARLRTPWVADEVAKLAFPRYAVAQPTREAAAALLSRDDLTPGLRRVITDADDDLRRALVARTAVAATTA